MTDYPFRQAKCFHTGRMSAVDLIVIHAMESSEKPTTAEACAEMFATMDRKASAHLCIDSDSIVQCVRFSDTAFHAAHVNSKSIGIEHAGKSAQSAAEWNDGYSAAMLKRSAAAARALADTYGVPLVRLGVGDVKAGKRGFTDHASVEKAFPSTGHTDPGPNFPWDAYLSMVRGGGAAA